MTRAVACIRLFMWVSILNLLDGASTLAECRFLGVSEANPVMGMTLDHSIGWFLIVKVAGVGLCAGLLLLHEQKMWLIGALGALSLTMCVHLMVIGYWLWT